MVKKQPNIFTRLDLMFSRVFLFFEKAKSEVITVDCLITELRFWKLTLENTLYRVYTRYRKLLACSEKHIRDVFEMLKRQPETPIFTGGLEAKLLRSWHVDLLRSVKPKRMYFAYDTPEAYEPLLQAGKLLRDGGITKASQSARCYVLVGYDGDTMEKAEKRLRDAWAAGFFPFAMLYRDEKGEVQRDWQQFQRLWARPQITSQLLKT